MNALIHNVTSAVFHSKTSSYRIYICSSSNRNELSMASSMMVTAHPKYNNSSSYGYRTKTHISGTSKNNSRAQTSFLNPATQALEQ
jgi:hypothetical protein